ncbi:MAG TPA: hypothetical protein VFO65_01315, partial [Acidimicrobiales bacterium]|nr:hypothetical protein [Acidimicrobiales bacterium]
MKRLGRRAAAVSFAILLVGTLGLVVVLGRPAVAQVPSAPTTPTTVLPCVPADAFPVIDPARVCP